MFSKVKVVICTVEFV